MRRRMSALLLAAGLMLAMVSCSHAPTWEEQFDLGVRYLQESNYEEAILAFTAAIEIDSSKADAFLNRGRAYAAAGGAENLRLALADYETALSLGVEDDGAEAERLQIVKQLDYEDALVWADETGITEGPDTPFSPDEPCTRAEAMTYIWNTVGQPAPDPNTDQFMDVGPQDYCYRPVMWAEDIMSLQYYDGTAAFYPSDPCTRGDAVYWIWEAAERPAGGTASKFSDVRLGYTDLAVSWAYTQGIADGTSETEFSPDAGCTKGEMVAFLYHAFKQHENDTKITYETVQPETDPRGDNFIGRLTAADRDGNILWTHETVEGPLGQIGYFPAIGKRGDRYYIVEPYGVAAINLSDGSTTWKVPVSDHPDLVESVFGEDAMYLSFRGSPEFLAVSYDGQILKSIDWFDEDYSINDAVSPKKISISDNHLYYTLAIDMEADILVPGIKTFAVDLSTYEVEEYEPEKSVWKSAYMDYAVNDGKLPGTGHESYFLADVDGNGIAEMIIDADTAGEGCELCTYVDGKVESYHMNFFSYIPGQNLVHDSAGRKGIYHDIIYSMEDGKLRTLHEGGYHHGGYDDTGGYTYLNWDGEQLDSWEEYKSLLNAAFDTSREVYSSDKSYGYFGLISHLTDY